MSLVPARARWLELASATLAHLPSAVDPLIGAAGGIVAFVANPARRRLVAENQAAARGAVLTTNARDRLRGGWWALSAHCFYARYWVEILRLAHLSPSQVAAMVQPVNALDIIASRRRGEAVIAVLAHVGNWEWGGAWASAALGGVTTVAERLTDESMTDWFLRHRQDLGMEIVLTGRDSLRPLLRALAAGKLVALLVDRDLTGTGRVVEFLGRPTRMPTGPAVLATMTGAPIVPVATYQAPHGRHRVEFLTPILPRRTGDREAELQRLTQEIADAVAGIIARAPAQWHNFQAYQDPGA